MPDYALPFDADSELVVVEMAWTSGGLAAISRQIPFEQFAATCHRAADRAIAKRPRVGAPSNAGLAEPRRKLKEEFPWLSYEDIDNAICSKVPAGVAEGRHGSASESEPDGAQVASDKDVAVYIDMEAAFEHVAGELQELRDEHAVDSDDNEYFFMRIQGGRWTFGHKGVLADAATCFSISYTRHFCDRYRWPKQRGFAFSKYGQQEAINLATEWANRGNHFARIWYDAGCPDGFKFEPMGCHAFPETLEFVDWCLSSDPASTTWERIVEVRSAAPK